MVIQSLEFLFCSSYASVCLRACFLDISTTAWLASCPMSESPQQINLEQPFYPVDKVHLPPKALISFTHSLQWRKWGKDTAEWLHFESFVLWNHHRIVLYIKSFAFSSCSASLNEAVWFHLQWLTEEHQWQPGIKSLSYVITQALQYD